MSRHLSSKAKRSAAWVNREVAAAERDRRSWSRPAVWPHLDSADVHVWRAYLPEILPRLAHIGDVLAEDEYVRARHIHSTRDRQQFLAGRTALRVLLGAYLDMDAGTIGFEYGRHGKPALAPACRRGDLNFNLSHSRDWVVCAVSRGRALGVDVEYRRAGFEFTAVAERVLSPAEWEMFNGLGRRVRGKFFFDAWSRKEAYVKAIGQGVFYPFAGIEIDAAIPGAPRLVNAPLENFPTSWSLRDLPVGGDYSGALALIGPVRTLGLWEWDGLSHNRGER